jgi:hypothetical protein
MLTFALSYHQVSPAFLEHIFTFGQQEYARDFHFIRFKGDNTFKDHRIGLVVPELGRSGRELRLFYTLKSIESSSQQKHWPWSVRQIALYHTFDTQTGHSNWIVIKGDDLMKERIMDSMKGITRRSLETFDAKFALTLQTHLLLCQWACDHFLRYISDLEVSVQKATRRALYTDINPRIVRREEETILPLSTRTTLRSFAGSWSLRKSKTASIFEEGGLVSSSFRNAKPSKIFGNMSQRMARQRDVDGTTTEATPNMTSSGKMIPPELPPNKELKGNQPSNDQLLFGDLQFSQQLIEKIQEALLVVSLNRKVIVEIRQYYNAFLNSEYFPESLNIAAISDFCDDINSVETDLSLLISRFEALLSLTQERKQVVSRTKDMNNKNTYRV